MAIGRFRRRNLLFVLFCVILIFWAIIVIDWAHIDNVKRVSKFRSFPSSVEKWSGVPESRRSLLKDGRLEHGSRKTENIMKSHSYFSAEKNPWMFPRPLSELEKKIVPNQVFFIWCQNRTFTFNDYLSVLSVWKFLEPDKLEIHRYTEVRTDNYNQWFMELNRTVPVFSVHTVKPRKKSICYNPLHYALEVLSDRGGMFMDFSTVLVRPLHHLRDQEFSISFNELGNVSFIMSKIKSSAVRRILERPDIGITRMMSMLKEAAKTAADLCPSLSSSLPLVVLTRTKRESLCLTFSTELILKPLDLQDIENETLTILKDLYYVEQRKEEECLDAQRKNKSFPFIVHYVWFGASEFSFRMYLSFLSTIHVAKAEKVYIHCNQRLTGYYWRIVAAHPRVTVVYRERPGEIYGHRVLYTQHVSDVVRADVLDKYGGVYLDWDVLWLQSPAPLLTSGHEAIVDLDHMPRPDFPDVLNLGVFLAAPRARFVRLWRWELRNYRSWEFYYNALELPYKVYERHPDTVFIEARLQVMCFWLKCHPIFHPDHKDWSVAQPFNWRTDAYSIHFTHPDPEEYDSITSLLNGTGTFAEIGKFILDVSGELGLN